MAHWYKRVNTETAAKSANIAAQNNNKKIEDTTGRTVAKPVSSLNKRYKLCCLLPALPAFDELMLATRWNNRL